VFGAVSVQAFLDGIGPNQARYFYLGSPVTDAEIGDFNEGNILVAANSNQGSIWQWNASGANWQAPNSTNDIATNGLGYAIFAGNTNAGTFLRGDEGTITMTGTVPMADMQSPLGYHNGQGISQSFVGGNTEADTEGWNLIANPFPAVYDWDLQTIPADMSSVMYVFDGTNYNSYIKGAGSASRYISPFQGFFVQLTENTPGNLNFEAANRIAGQSPELQKNGPHSIDGVDLIVTTKSNAASDLLFVGFDNKATPYFDLEFDAHKILNTAGVPNLYAVLYGESYSVCRTKATGSLQSFPLKLRHSIQGDSLTISADLNRLHRYRYVMLEDLKTQKLHDLTQAEYNFVNDTAFAEARFMLHFSNKENIALKNSVRINWFVYSNDLGVMVCLDNSENTRVRVLNSSGVLVHESDLTQTETLFPLYKRSVYIIEINRAGVLEYEKVLF